MDRNTIIGFGLIFLMLIGMQYFQNQNRVEAEAAQRVQDSIALVQHQQDSIAQALEAEKAQEAKQLDPSQQVLLDSLQQLQRAQSFGGFAAASTGQEEEVILENDVLKVTFSNKGGRITSVLLKEYFKMGTVEEGDKKYPLYLLEDERNKFEYTLPLNNGTKVSTSDLFFDVERSGNSIVFRAKASDDQFFEQKYTLTDGSYAIGYDLKTNGLDNLLASSADEIQLNWENYLTKIERNVDYERRMSSVYFKTVDDDTDYCNCNKSDIERIEDERITWIAHSSQFFNSALMTTDAPFQSGVMETVVPEADADVTYLKKLISEVNIPTEELSDGFNMQFYVGPKDYERLSAFNNELQYTVPFGISIFGTVNRYIVRPLFGFLLSFISSKGIVILVLTLIVKLLLFPLTYKMLYSQSKMGALKPQIAKVREKYKDDAQQQQMETMKMYREFGVNPLGGCMPMVLQMPIWFALYRFFPASIEFRQASFLWANDLSSFDVFTLLPFDIPFYGGHVSLFTILWAIATVGYTVYNSRNMDMSQMNNPAMKYMQYFMPVMFLFFFNNFASGLTCYLLFSSVFNILQTLITKNVIINQDKVKEELENYKKKPKKKGGFQQRLEQAMKQQQQIQEQRQKQQQQRKGSRKKKK
ncbi:MAG: membrane protein insertase YidC [Bacteroidota bacterium]